MLADRTNTRFFMASFGLLAQDLELFVERDIGVRADKGLLQEDGTESQRGASCRGLHSIRKVPFGCDRLLAAGPPCSYLGESHVPSPSRCCRPAPSGSAAILPVSRRSLAFGGDGREAPMNGVPRVTASCLFQATVRIDPLTIVRLTPSPVSRFSSRGRPAPSRSAPSPGLRPSSFADSPSTPSDVPHVGADAPRPQKGPHDDGVSARLLAEEPLGSRLSSSLSRLRRGRSWTSASGPPRR